MLRRIFLTVCALLVVGIVFGIWADLSDPTLGVIDFDPTHTPTATVTPTITPTDTNTPTPTAVPPTPTRTLIPSTTPYPTATPQPTATPWPTRVPETPFSPTPTPANTATPTITPAPSDTPTPIPAIAPIETLVSRAAPIVVTEQSSQGPCLCSGDLYNCEIADFDTHASAQECFDHCRSAVGGDVHGLDREEDGLACENLP